MSQINASDIIDIVVPVHNEGESIENTLREFYEIATQSSIKVRFIICEDGSKDNTVAVLQKLLNELPIVLITSKERKGYSKAVIDGFKAATSNVVGFIDSDGQCDPNDLKKLHNMILKDYDFVVGYRNPRSDHWIRRLMSWLFKCVYNSIFAVPFRDPSCPYLLVKKPYLDNVLLGNVGILKQGFWWEFLARIHTLHPKSIEVPINHRSRQAGNTQVYKLNKVPRIAFEHLIGLFTLKRELMNKK